MKLGELFVQLGVQGDTKELKKTLADMKEADKLSSIELKKRKALKEATSEEDKALIQKNADNKKEIVQLEKTIKGKENAAKAAMGLVRGFVAIASTAALVFTAVDRMASALVKANASMITFNRTTGIGLNSLNKYASASMAVNPNATIEGTAQTMGNLAQNLYDIRMGRGDISPYQELGFVGGKAFNPVGMSVEQVIESVREAIKGVDDIQATNIITRMGFSPEDLQMLRMSRQELEGIQSLFLNPAEREELQKRGIELKKLHMQMQLYKDRALLAIMPLLIKITNVLSKFVKRISEVAAMWGTAAKKVWDFVSASKGLQSILKGLAWTIGILTVAFNPLIGIISAIYLVLEDIVGYFLGWDTLIIPALKAFGNFIGDWVADIAKKFNMIKMPKWVEGLGNIISGLGHAIWDTVSGNYTQGLLNQYTPQPVPVGQNPNVSYNNQSSNVTQNNNFRISALPENMAGEVGDSITKASYNAIIAQNMVTA